MTTLTAAPDLWRTELYRRLSRRLDGVIGAAAKPLESLKLQTVGDLVHLLPRRYVSSTDFSDLAAVRVGTEVVFFAEVESARMPERSGPRPRLSVTLTDGRTRLSCTFFGRPRMIDFWLKQLRPGETGIFAGKVGEFRGVPQLANPDFVIVGDEGAVTGGAKRNAGLAKAAKAALVPIYPMTRKVRTWTIADCVALAYETLVGTEDPLPPWIRDEAEVIDLVTALRCVHLPATREEVSRGQARLRFDEAFGLQLTMAVRRHEAAGDPAVPRPRHAGGLLDAFDARLPFTLTPGQTEIGELIADELARPHPMQRLLQGEVGSGKTLIALRAMLGVVDAGGQAALLAPTEVLATQHLQTIHRLLGDLGQGDLLSGSDQSTQVALLTGSMTAAQKRRAREQIASGEAGLVVGTHALLSTGVDFADLGLVVVDEQHRFGVEQRAALGAKARSRPHVLVMTATPIPRTVAMTVFGDLETSTLRDIPQGRADVSTVVVDQVRQPGWVDRAWRRIVEEVGNGRQAYVVCARISATDPVPAADAVAVTDPTLDLADEPERPPPIAVEELFAELSAGALSSVTVEMLHGKLTPEEKDAAMGRFNAGQTDVLVATTVIEVGVDVPNASVMVICDADRFGISQLHQLRGRIGRGGHPGVCLLLTAAEPGTPARSRLDSVASTRDGFALAEVDLEQRREGDVLGASQSGARSSLKLLRVVSDADLIAEARGLAERALATDPTLSEAGLADIVTEVELNAASEWLERS